MSGPFVILIVDRRSLGAEVRALRSADGRKLKSRSAMAVADVDRTAFPWTLEPGDALTFRTRKAAEKVRTLCQSADHRHLFVVDTL